MSLDVCGEPQLPGSPSLSSKRLEELISSERQHGTELWVVSLDFLEGIIVFEPGRVGPFHARVLRCFCRDISCGIFSEKSALWTDAGVDGKTFRGIWEPLVRMNFKEDSYGPKALCLVSGRCVWTNGPETSSKVSPRLALVHGWFFPIFRPRRRNSLPEFRPPPPGLLHITSDSSLRRAQSTCKQLK